MNVFRLSLLGQDDDGEGDWDAAVAELAAHASSTSGLDLPWDDDASASTRSRQPSLESLDSAVSGRSRPSSCELSPVVESPARAAAKVSFDDYDALGDAGARHTARRGSRSVSWPRGAAAAKESAATSNYVARRARVSPPKVFSPLEAEARSCARASTPSRGATWPPAAPVVASVATTASPAAKAALKTPARRAARREASRSATRLPAPAATSAPTARSGRTSRPASAARSSRRRRLGRRRRSVVWPNFLEYHNKIDLARRAGRARSRAGKTAAAAAAAAAARGRHADVGSASAAGRAARRAPQATPSCRGGGRGLGRRPGAGPRALRRGRRTLRCLPSVARDNGRSIDQSLLQWALNRDEEPVRGAGRIGVAGVHLEALAKGFDVRGSRRRRGPGWWHGVHFSCCSSRWPRGGVKVGHRVSIDVAMAVTDGLDDLGSGLRRLVYQFFDRPPTVVVAEGPLRHAASLELEVTPALFSYLSSEALLVEVRLVDRRAGRGGYRVGASCSPYCVVVTYTRGGGKTGDYAGRRRRRGCGARAGCPWA